MSVTLRSSNNPAFNLFTWSCDVCYTESASFSGASLGSFAWEAQSDFVQREACSFIQRGLGWHFNERTLFTICPTCWTEQEQARIHQTLIREAEKKTKKLQRLRQEREIEGKPKRSMWERLDEDGRF